MAATSWNTSSSRTTAQARVSLADSMFRPDRGRRAGRRHRRADHKADHLDTLIIAGLNIIDGDVHAGR
jgi:hypothetical protein